MLLFDSGSNLFLRICLAAVRRRFLRGAACILSIYCRFILAALSALTVSFGSILSILCAVRRFFYLRADTICIDRIIDAVKIKGGRNRRRKDLSNKAVR